MPRRGNDVVTIPEPPRKKNKVLPEEPPSLEVSFFDDEALPSGIVFNDVQQKKWRIGKPIGRGSFGRIYLASDEVDSEVTKLNARYVVKIEPHTNGPLFVEIHCLIRTAQTDKVNGWRLQKKQKHFGMPVYIASGSFTDEHSGVKYRFLVLPRYDIDLQKIIARTRVLDLKNVLVLAIQILDVLEYLHSQGYTHSDIKSSNLMLGFDASKLAKFKVPKPAQSFQKGTKDLAVLSGKHRKVKTGKSRSSNYYDDEDYISKDHKSGFNYAAEKDRKLATVKNKLRKILSDKDSRISHRNHAFNLRHLSNYVNYEDFNSSVCSDQSYQRLLDDFDKHRLAYSTDEGFHEDLNLEKKTQVSNLDDIYREAVMSQSPGQIYLLDYGLAWKFLDSQGNHKDFGMDARKAHDGTLEYSSRDSHIGAHSRRSDLETLGFNLLDWLTGTLPWKTTEMLSEPDLVHALKKTFMSDVKSLLKTCFKTDYYPQFLETFLQYVTNLDFTEKPDYDYCRRIFRNELTKNGLSDKELSLNFSEPPMPPIGRKKLCYSKRFCRKNTPQDFLARNGVKKTYESENIYSLENDLKLELLKQTLNSSSDGIRKPCSSRNFFISDADLVARLKKSLMPHEVFDKKLSPKNLRSKKKTIQRKKGKRGHRSNIGKFGNFMGSARQFTWAEILAGNPEDLLRKERNAANTTVDDDDEEDDEETFKYRIRKLSNSSSDNFDSNLQSPLLHKDYLQNMNPTYAMKEVVTNFKKKMSGKISKESEDVLECFEGYTPAMIKLYKIKEKREAKEKLEAAKSAKNENSSKTLQQNLTESEPRCTRSKANTKIKNEHTIEVVKNKHTFEVAKNKHTIEVAKNKHTVKVAKNKHTVEVAKNKHTVEVAENKQTVENAKNKHELTVGVAKRVTRKQVSDSEMKVKSAEIDKGIVKTKCNTRLSAKSKRTNNIKTNPKLREVKIVIEVPQPPLKSKSSSPIKKVRETTLPANRRRLRSSRRIKQ